MDCRTIDLTGKRYGRWLVLRYVKIEVIRRSHWECLCDCGTVRVIDGEPLRRGSSKSCGCLHRELVAERSRQVFKHRRAGTKEYKQWQAMKSRCLTSHAPGYENYGGRGITICEEWLHSFERFYNDLGPCPDKYSLERIDNAKGYAPTNCKWASRLEQNNNTRKNKYFTYGGETKTLAQWARQYNLSYSGVRNRFTRGLTPHEILHPLRRGRWAW